eukprot:jgi/Undpi1/10364/HiC_scaffold_29.g12814.m1
MSARTKLDACIKDLEDSLGVAPEAGNGPRAPAAATSAAQLLDNVIANLEASLGLQPGEAVSVAGVTEGTASVAAETGGVAKGAYSAAKGTAEKTGTSKGYDSNVRKKTNAKGKGKKGATAAPAVSAVDQPDGTKVDLRVGVISKVWVHESADTLYCEEIDVGEEEPRKIASGLVPHYSVDEMEGRRVVVFCNLKPRTLKGFKSHGMVVCAVAASSEGKEKVELVVPPEGAEVGERLKFDGLEGGPFEPVSAAQMEKKKVLDRVLKELATDGDGTVKWREHPLASSCGPCTAPTVRNGAVR